ncbi:MAG: flagellar basal-body MS-ring/collar protein FliF [Verrucomicrobiota bacterium]|jgi:flagellar M-ring protein FliF|nr:flagellar basal-body MS-ring/collar protein FliF [Verrucomicrobiota bacterium]
MQSIKELLKQLAGIWSELGLNQKVTVMGAGLAVIVALVAVLIWGGRTDYVLLYGNLDAAEAGRVTQALDESNVKYQISQGGGAVYVPASQVHQMRMQLATQGIPKAEGIGYELLDKNTLGMSDFMQHANYNRAVQGELARTIAKFNGIDSARVMIVSPENRLLIDPGRHATASVFLTMRGMSRPSSETVNAIQMLVANSIEGLSVNHVSVVDNSGNVLSIHDEEGSLVAVTSSRLRARQELENYLGKKVESMLEKVVGPGNVVARVSANINTDSETITSEVYGPDDKAIKTENKTTEQSTEPSAKPGGPAGVTPNIATGGANTQVPAASTNQVEFLREDTLSEYAVSKYMTNKVVLPGQIKELNAAIFVNTTNPPAGLVGSLHKAAVLALGSYVTDTNKVQVQSVSFDTSERDQMLAAVGSSNFWTRFWDLGKNLMYVALLLGGLFLVVRTFKNTSEEFIPTGMTVGELMAERLAAEGPAITAGEGVRLTEGQAPGTAGQAGTPTETPVEEEEDEVEMITEEKKKLVMDFGLGSKQPERVTVEVLKDLIEEKPDKMSQAARNWLLSGGDSDGKV